MLAHKFGLKSNKYYKSKQMELQKNKNIEYKKKRIQLGAKLEGNQLV